MEWFSDYDPINAQQSPFTSYPGSEFIGYNDTQKPDISLIHKFNAIMNLGEQAGYYAAEKLPDFQSTASTQEFIPHQLNSHNVSTDNSEENKFMGMGNSDQYAITSPVREEASVENSLGSQSPTDSQSMTTEEKTTGKTDSGQSIYKNKYKETFEQAKAIIDELSKIKKARFAEVKRQAEKSAQDWEGEGFELGEKIKAFEESERQLDKVKNELEEIQADIKREKSILKDLEKVRKTLKELRGKSTKNEKELKKLSKQIEKARIEEESLLNENTELKKRLPYAKESENAKKKEQKTLVKMFEGPKTQLLEALKAKRLVRFAPIYELLDEIQAYVNKDESFEYFENYKKKRSMKYFEHYMGEEEHFYWILLLKVVLLLIPQQKTTLQLLPLKKETVPFMYWLMDSPIMKLKHKNLFKESYVRSHLRAEFSRVCNTLVFSAKKKFEKGEWSQEKWILLQKVLSAGEEIPELFIASTNTPMAEEMIFGTDESHTCEEETSKRYFSQLSYNDESTFCDEDYHDVEKRFFPDHS